MTTFSVAEVKEFSFEEFPFENINNLTSHKGLLILKHDPFWEYSLRNGSFKYLKRLSFGVRS